jgi:N-acetyl-anhydromuramyl-L-alanine amidase AmpD
LGRVKVGRVLVDPLLKVKSFKEETMPLAKDVASYEKDAFAVMMRDGELAPGDENSVSVFDCSPRGRSGYFYRKKKKKKRIVLHFTAGFLGGDLDTLTRRNYHVSVSFVVARDGRVYRLFDTDHWSYHLGKAAIGGNTACSSTSIGIEISNIGPLRKRGNWLWNTYGTKYCRTNENQYYTTGPEYRSYTSYATFTNAQYLAVNDLITALCDKHEIPRSFIPKSRRFKTFANPESGRAYTGICSHVNYRKYGKTDIGPMFDWDKIGG